MADDREGDVLEAPLFTPRGPAQPLASPPSWIALPHPVADPHPHSAIVPSSRGAELPLIG